jgi:hypothetical protein
VKRELGRASDGEALRLVTAFLCVMEPERRAAILSLAEKYARSSQVVEGYTHFLLLQKGEAPSDVSDA